MVLERAERSEETRDRLGGNLRHPRLLKDKEVETNKLEMSNDYTTDYKLTGGPLIGGFGAGMDGFDLDYKSPLFTPRKNF